MRKAVAGLGTEPDILLNDAVTIPEVVIPQIPIVKGDAKACPLRQPALLQKSQGTVLWWNMKAGFRDMALLQIRDMVLQSILKRCGGWGRPRFTETVLSVILSEHMEAAPGKSVSTAGVIDAYGKKKCRKK